MDELVGLLQGARERLRALRVGDLGKPCRDGFGRALALGSGKYAPCVSMICATAKAPAPAHRMVRVGASSLTRYRSPGVIDSGVISASMSGGIRSSVMRVAAVGDSVLTRMSFLRPSCASTFIRPTTPALAAP